MFDLKVCFSTVAMMLLFFTSLTGSNDVSYHAVKVRTGDGITTLLERYHLENHKCNVKKFCELNNVKLKDQLFTHKKYKLPIVILGYDGKSIRSSIGVEDIEKASRIKKYNEKLKANGLRKQSFTKDNKLFVPYHELECGELLNSKKAELINDKKLESDKAENVSTTDKRSIVTKVSNLEKGEKEDKKIIYDGPTIKATESVKINALFGANYERVELEDQSLRNKVFYIISGHGGPDPGAVCEHTAIDMCEDEYAYDVSLRLARNLTQHGAIVHMIVQDKNDGIRDEAYLNCDHDEEMCTGSTIPRGQISRLKIRTDAVNTLYSKYKKKGIKFQRLIEIHVDSRSESHRQDVFFYHYNGEESKKIAKNLHNVFDSKYEQHQKDRGYHGYVKERGLFTLRKARPASVYIELANISNTEDHKRLIINTNRQALANWLFEGLIK